MLRFAGSLRLAALSLAMVSVAWAAPQQNELVVGVFDDAGNMLTDVAVAASSETGPVKATIAGNGTHVLTDVGALGPDGIKLTLELGHWLYGAQQMDLLFEPNALMRVTAIYDGAGIVTAISPDLLPYPAPTGNGDGAPANDDCSGAGSLSLGGSVAGTTLGATFDDVGTCGTSNTAPGVWYTVEGNGSEITLDTCNAGTDYDTKLSVFCGGCDDLQCITGNDDGPAPCVNFQSSVTFCSEAGATYYVLVHGFSTGQGNFVLSATSGAPCSATTNCAATGACCYEDGSCAILTEGACADSGGEYQGDNSPCFGAGGAGDSYGPGAGGAIPDNDPGGISSVINVGDSFAVGDVTVDLAVNHTWTGDLIVTLSHGGDSAVLVNRQGVPALGTFGCPEDNWNVTLDDSAGTAMHDACAANLVGTFNTGGALAAFAGSDSAGDWTLNITDNAGADTGALVSWSLNLGTAGEPVCPPPECYLVAGDAPGLSTFDAHEVGHQFLTQVSSVDASDIVWLDDAAEFVLPIQKRRANGAVVTGPLVSGGVNGNGAGNLSNGAPGFMADGQFAIQVVMWNPAVFPGQPEQFTHGLLVTIHPDGRVSSEAYGQSAGDMTVWHEVGFNDQGQRVIRFPFEIPGFQQ